MSRPNAQVFILQNLKNIFAKYFKKVLRKESIAKTNLTILACKGDLPYQAYKILQEIGGYNISIASVLGRQGQDFHEQTLKIFNLPYKTFQLTEVGAFFEFLRQQKSQKLLILGSVEKPNFESVKTDSAGKNMISKIVKSKIFTDDFILKIITHKIQKATGVKVESLNKIAKNIMATKNDATIKKPTPAQINIIKKGFCALKKLSKLDLAQSIAISNAGILGIEGPEGTDNLLKRAATYYTNWNDKNGGKLEKLLVKTTKLGQSKKADVPVIGLNTARVIVELGYEGIAIKSGEVIILDKENVIKTLNENGKFLAIF